MKKVLFIQREDALIVTPEGKRQTDSLDELEFCPGVFQWLSRIVKELDYEPVMVTDTKTTPTPGEPDPLARQVQQKILKAFENEGVLFSEILTGKPGEGPYNRYVYGGYDLENSYVIGSGTSAAWLSAVLKVNRIPSKNIQNSETFPVIRWEDVYILLKAVPRKATVSRNTKETRITVTLDLDGTGRSDIQTGIGFFDHMLEQIARHGNMDLDIRALGDLNVDQHHTVEDVAITLGQAFLKALGSRRGIERYGFLLPMDDALARVAVDLGGRPYLVWKVRLKGEMTGQMPSGLFVHFFRSFADAARCNLHISGQGDDDHHKIEAVFKAFAKALGMAKSGTDVYSIPSTKGML
ncbi:MAG: imidazoleglycerol-phosphate dehydratase HisB [Bacteroidales bacterium]|jgi:imidazoleglycerol-phosphate dehydratase/histidinol-phosphatase|nr:imidazoleglycerol-phosphate dehydratase HisB [Bacteroidales bacterium]MDD2824653.1 imidazoleglycerol-phosphate dehydratase HisB [Bacteroidales bacterium]MDD3101025.1 imidazoleglycerol-phosphate dehydratase HisB [Bacteroidales bacterium]MDD3639914.1 imidazoleglycerol-phosphate dehydratase HisB [Bacteroidales bacterium]MDD3944955.1 imidazoleglycerol-phosphate dehydratase HisB [Bacteroidales bacterium]